MRVDSCWSFARSADVSAVRSADVSNPGTARLRGSGLLAPRHCMATVACSKPAFVYSCVAQNKKISILSLHSAVENGSFQQARPIQREMSVNRLTCVSLTRLHDTDDDNPNRPEALSSNLKLRVCLLSESNAFIVPTTVFLTEFSSTLGRSSANES